MPIYDQSFRHYTGPRNLKQNSRTIAQFVMKPMLKNKLFTISIVLFVIILVVFSTSLYGISEFVNSNLAENFRSQPRRPRGGPGIFQGLQQMLQDGKLPVSPVMFFCYVSTIWAAMFLMVTGSATINNDKKFNALPLYFSRPLRLRDYVFGKFLGLFLLPFAAVVTVQLLVFIQVWAYFYSASEIVHEIPGFLKGILCSFMGCAMLAVSLMAFSAISRNARAATLGFIVFYFMSDRIARGVSRYSEYATMLSPYTSVRALASNLLYTGPMRESMESTVFLNLTLPWHIALMSVVGYTALFLFLTIRSIRVVEVVK